MENVRDGKQQCPRCKCWRNPDDYQGKRGVVKNCKWCRDKWKRQDQRPDRVEVRNARFREKKYYQAHRERKRAEDETAFLSQNAARAKEWRDKNGEHVRHWRNTNSNYCVKHIQQQALKKGIQWNLTAEIAAEMVRRECVYCGHLDLETRVNGIDRLNSSGSYTTENTVPCCGTCNFLKKCLDPVTFRERCVHITAYAERGDTPFREAWIPKTPGTTFSAYRARAEKKGLLFELSPEQFRDFRCKPCKYCGDDRAERRGIDRRDNQQGYTIDNVVACCGECNCMKTRLSDTEFLNACHKVAVFSVPLPERALQVPRARNVIRRR